ncbi:MAG: hypothetical protein HY855_25905 [Burkholderiales bacterium]|nr:hypothetical protein [Burkholderiales bacterium]
MTTDAPALPADLAEFIQSGTSITVAGRDDRLVPSIAKGAACRVGAAGREVTVLLFAEAAEAVLRDIATNRLVAVVFSRPSTNRTVQLKGRDALCVPTAPADVALVRRQLALFAADLGQLGWNDEFVRAVFWHDPAQLMAIRFTPDGAFAQTPGPGAGAALSLHAGAP